MGESITKVTPIWLQRVSLPTISIYNSPFASHVIAKLLTPTCMTSPLLILKDISRSKNLSSLKIFWRQNLVAHWIRKDACYPVLVLNPCLFYRSCFIKLQEPCKDFFMILPLNMQCEFAWYTTNHFRQSQPYKQHHLPLNKAPSQGKIISSIVTLHLEHQQKIMLLPDGGLFVLVFISRFIRPQWLISFKLIWKEKTYICICEQKWENSQAREYCMLAWNIKQQQEI
jgi:hypothetical protein